VLRIHGGPTAQYDSSFRFEWQLLAAHGYLVIAANPRGSTGYGRDFAHALWADWGDKDFADEMAAVDLAVALGVADPGRLGVGGWSYGGILTDYVITKTGRFKAAIAGASETNFLANYGTDHYQYAWETELGLPWRNVERWLALSPWFQVETTPMCRRSTPSSSTRRCAASAATPSWSSIPARRTASAGRASSRTATSAISPGMTST
jgi:dipeptidyl aminopeptidase/acylaminoacyl peptidase